MCGCNLSSSPFIFYFLCIVLHLLFFSLSTSRVNFTHTGVGLTAPEMRCERERVHQTSDDDKMCKSVRDSVYMWCMHIWHPTSHGLVWAEQNLQTNKQTNRECKRCHVGHRMSIFSFTLFWQPSIHSQASKAMTVVAICAKSNLSPTPTQREVHSSWNRKPLLITHTVILKERKSI